MAWKACRPVCHTLQLNSSWRRSESNDVTWPRYVAWSRVPIRYCDINTYCSYLLPCHVLEGCGNIWSNLSSHNFGQPCIGTLGQNFLLEMWKLWLLSWFGCRESVVVATTRLFFCPKSCLDELSCLPWHFVVVKSKLGWAGDRFGKFFTDILHQGHTQCSSSKFVRPIAKIPKYSGQRRGAWQASQFLWLQKLYWEVVVGLEGSIPSSNCFARCTFCQTFEDVIDLLQKESRKCTEY